MEFNRALLGDGGKESPDNDRHLKYDEGAQNLNQGGNLGFRAQAGHKRSARSAESRCVILRHMPLSSGKLRRRIPQTMGLFVTKAYDNGNDSATFATFCP